MNAPLIRIYHHGSKKWVVSQPSVWTGEAWGQAIPEDAGSWFGSLWAPYVGAGTVATRDVSAMPLHEHSAKIAAYMPVLTYETTQRIKRYQDDPSITEGDGYRPLQPFGPRGATGVNTVQFNIPVYVVDSSIPGCDLAPMQAGGVSAERQAMVSGVIPIPHWATPSEPAGWGDLAMAIYDRHTGIMREYYGCAQDADGRWTSQSCGYYHARRGFEGLAETNYGLQLTEGRSAVAGMLTPLLQIGIAEARAGEVNHAIGVTLADGLNQYSWPATGGDGKIDPAVNPDLLTSGYWPPAQGQWFRLRPDVDVDGLPLRPFTKLIARAVQRYGGVGIDKNWFCHAFNCEPPHVEQHWSATSENPAGNNPWETDVHEQYEELVWYDRNVLGITYPDGVNNPLDVGDFPWHLTQWAPLDWGKR